MKNVTENKSKCSNNQLDNHRKGSRRFDATPYDDVHRTLLTDCKELILPVVNEVFKEDYTGDEEIILSQNELFIRQQDNTKKRITDTSFKIISGAGVIKSYHVECQSTADNSMIIRMFEYDSQIALQNGVRDAEKLEVHFPRSAVLYLRHNEKTPSVMKVNIHTSGGDITYEIPVIKVQVYSIDEIFEKRLYYLILFHIFTYEKEFPAYDKDSDKLTDLKVEYQNIMSRLQSCCEEGLLEEYTMQTIIDMSKKVLDNIAADYGHVKEEVHSVMGGKVLNYRTKRIYNRGVAQGISQGIITKGISVFLRLLHDGMPLDKAQELADIDDATVKIALEQHVGTQE